MLQNNLLGCYLREKDNDLVRYHIRWSLSEERYMKLISSLISQTTCSYHPYLFFHHDGVRIIFVGFTVNKNGDIIDPLNSEVIERKAITPQLYEGLRLNLVNLDDEFQRWDRATIIEKMSQVMGLKLSTDPDPTYVLTLDNLIKILAIHMRFRWDVLYHRHCRTAHLLHARAPYSPLSSAGATSQWW